MAWRGHPHQECLRGPIVAWSPPLRTRRSERNGTTLAHSTLPGLPSSPGAGGGRLGLSLPVSNLSEAPKVRGSGRGAEREVSGIPHHPHPHPRSPWYKGSDLSADSPWGLASVHREGTRQVPGGWGALAWEDGSDSAGQMLKSLVEITQVGARVSQPRGNQGQHADRGGGPAQTQAVGKGGHPAGSRRRGTKGPSLVRTPQQPRPGRAAQKPLEASGRGDGGGWTAPSKQSSLWAVNRRACTRLRVGAGADDL